MKKMKNPTLIMKYTMYLTFIFDHVTVSEKNVKMIQLNYTITMVNYH